MSRVDDDRDAARVAARMAEAKRTEEAQRGKKAAENNAFSKLVKGQAQEKQVAQDKNLAKSAIAQLLEAAEAGQTQEAGKTAEHGAQSTQQQSAFNSRLSFKGAETRLKENARTDGQQGQQVKEQADQGMSQTQSSRSSDQSSSAKAAQGRSGDAKVSRERVDERKEAGESSASSAHSGAGGVSGKGEKGDIKADADKGGQQGGGNKDDKGGGAAAANPGFRFNPALMAPVPVSKAKEASGSERLRKVANEVAQKIVERVRVGTNAAGKMEFQIDLKGEVLSGMSIKVSAKNGKISAVFSGSDKDVLKMIEEQGEALKQALGARGLTLEDFKTEAKT